MTSPPDFKAMEYRYDHKTLWARLVCIVLGLVLAVTPLTFEYGNDALFYNDLITGLLVAGIGYIWLRRPNDELLKWVLFFIGVWLQLAPLIFWAPQAVTYLNETLMGALLIGITTVLPTFQDMVYKPMQEVPPGWSFNPSSWPQRTPIAFFGLTGWLVARYLASYQLGYLDRAWDPVFGEGTERLLLSDFSKQFPISDVGFVATVYMIIALMAVKGGTSRWRTMPWLVLLYGFLVVPLGIASTTLILIQPIVVGHWCFLCLVMAFCTLIMIALALDEILAVVDFLAWCRRKQLPVGKILWQGGTCSDAVLDQRSPPVHSTLKTLFPAMTWGISLPWNLALTTLLGIWQLFATQYFGVTGWVDNVDHLVGALTVIFSVISWAEVTRSMRFLNIFCGIGLFLNMIFLEGHTRIEIINNSVLGILLILLSLRRGKILERYGNWQRKIR